MSKNHIEIAERFEAMKVDLAQAIYDGRIRGKTAVDQEFYERWAHRYIEWRKANYYERSKAAEPVKEIQGQGSLF